MESRYLLEDIQVLALNRNKMAFISGPRQCGKTTLAKILLKKRSVGRYYNWDDISFRKIWTKTPNTLTAIVHSPHDPPPLIVFDEIHKAKGWKQRLKGLYDTLENPYHILVTGSARLNVYKKGGDSLMGRYLLFRLHSFSLGELSSAQPALPDALMPTLFTNIPSSTKNHYLLFNDLYRYSGFPEPFLSQSDKICRIWRQSRIEKIIREDLRDLSRLPELSQIEMTVSLLPDRVGSPLSIQSLREDLEVSYDTMKRWITYLKELYYCFELKPWSKSIPRSLKKEGKLYLWDWSEINDDGPRFENMVACHLLKACHYWTDTGEGFFELFYLKNKQKKELDFLITRDKKPWLPVECKLSDPTPSKNFSIFLPYLGTSYCLQVIKTPNVMQSFKIGAASGRVISAAHFFSLLP